MTGMSRISRIFKIDIKGYQGISRDVEGNGVNDKEECLRTLKK